jgi:hypothetical protein
LDHLIIRAIRLRKKPLAEPIREIINDLGLSIGKEFAVVAVGGMKPASAFIGQRKYESYKTHESYCAASLERHGKKLVPKWKWDFQVSMPFWREQ